MIRGRRLYARQKECAHIVYAAQEFLAQDQACLRYAVFSAADDAPSWHSPNVADIELGIFGLLLAIGRQQAYLVIAALDPPRPGTSPYTCASCTPPAFASLHDLPSGHNVFDLDSQLPLHLGCDQTAVAGARFAFDAEQRGPLRPPAIWKPGQAPGICQSGAGIELALGQTLVDAQDIALEFVNVCFAKFLSVAAQRQVWRAYRLRLAACGSPASAPVLSNARSRCPVRAVSAAGMRC